MPSGFRSGYIGAYGLPFKGSLDLSDPHRIVPVTTEDPGRKPEAGDVYLGICGDYLSDEDPSYQRYWDVGCAYSPSARKLYRLDPVMAIDASGRTWTDSGRTLVVSDGKHRWRSRPFPSAPISVVTSDGDSAAVWLDDEAQTIFVTGDAGRSWRQVTGIPYSARTASEHCMLADGRLLVGPGNGQLWRGTDATNTSFEAVASGPLTTVLAAGDRVYGLANDASKRVLTGMAWMSEDAGVTWRQVIDPRRASVPMSQPVPADRLRPLRQPSVAELVKRLPPTDVAVSDSGLVLIVYGNPFTGSQTAWRLFDRRDRVLAEEPGGQGGEGGLTGVLPAGHGFLLQGSNFNFVDGTTQVRVNWDPTLSRPVRVGDVFIVDYGVYRPSTGELFNGLAEPNGVISTVDDTGRMWALGRHSHGRTVVRSAYPGRPWLSRDLGPSLRATDVQGKGSILMIVGLDQMYVSGDAGRTWHLVSHGASEYGEGAPRFTVLPDGSIWAGDERAGYRVSHDLRTFRDASEAELSTPKIGDLYARGRRDDLEVSADQQHWEPFTPSSARRLLTTHVMP
jgi:hypothetical protein